MNGLFVGTLSSRAGRLTFQYASDWIHMPGSRALSLSLPMQEVPITGDTVYAYFDNLLPDNQNIRQHIVDRLGAHSTAPFDLLATIGRDCVGAISLSSDQPSGEVAPLSIKEVDESDIAQSIKDTRLTNTLGMTSDDEFRISLAGAQEKTAFTLWEGKWCRPIGQTATTHIFKPPINHHAQMGLDLSSSVDNEWFCLRFLHHLGVSSADVEIMQFEDQKVLVVKRFDRRIDKANIVRLPQEDMCQALGKVSGAKYEEHGGPGAASIMDLLQTSRFAEHDQNTFMKTQLIFWLLAAIDGHAKNFSIFLTQGGFNLTPLYDVLSAYPYFNEGNIQPRKIKMAMKLKGKNSHYRWHNILKRHWLPNAKTLSFSEREMQQIIDDVIAQTPYALEKTMADANEYFDRNIGKAICDGVTQALKRLT